jgi:hypothetical protein
VDVPSVAYSAEAADDGGRYRSCYREFQRNTVSGSARAESTLLGTELPSTSLSENDDVGAGPPLFGSRRQDACLGGVLLILDSM